MTTAPFRLSPEEAKRAAEALGAALKRGDWSGAIRHFGTLAGRDTTRTSHIVEKLAAKYPCECKVVEWTQARLPDGSLHRA